MPGFDRTLAAAVSPVARHNEVPVQHVSQPRSQAGQQAIAAIAQRHGFGVDAVMNMLDAVVHGNGSMAQFNPGEFSGSGQWMRGGMTMVSDMFNKPLLGRVDSLCRALSKLVADPPGLLQTGAFQSQTQGAPVAAVRWGADGGPAAGGSLPTGTLFAPPAPDWWGPSLRYPNSTGAQNGACYAVFAQARRLAVELAGTVTIYDTLDHQIGGFSQQQSGDGTVSCSSQYGTVLMARLTVVSINGQAPFQAPAPAPGSNPAWGGGNNAGPPMANNRSGAAPADLLATLQKLADLHSAGLLTAEEFRAKKAELLSPL